MNKKKTKRGKEKNNKHISIWRQRFHTQTHTHTIEWNKQNDKPRIHNSPINSDNVSVKKKRKRKTKPTIIIIANNRYIWLKNKQTAIDGGLLIIPQYKYRWPFKERYFHPSIYGLAVRKPLFLAQHNAYLTLIIMINM